MPNGTAVAPRGVSRDVIYAELESKDREVDRFKKREKAGRVADARMFSKMIELGTGSTVALGTGALYAWKPRLMHFTEKKKVPTDGVFAALSLVGAFLTEDEAADVFMGATQGFGYPFLARMGAKMVKAV